MYLIGRYAPMLWAVSLGSCAARVPLSSVPIQGGTDSQVESLVIALDSFDAAVGRGRLELRFVRFGDVGDPIYSGRYSRGRIFLDPALGPDEIAGTAWHELCHALDDAEDLSAEQDDAITSLSEGPLAAYSDWVPGGSNAARREVFARLCELGPAASELFAADCGEPPEAAWAVFGWMSARVWRPTPPAVEPSSGGAAGSIVPTPGDFAVLAYDPDLRALRLALTYDGWQSSEYVAVGLDDGAMIADPPQIWPDDGQHFDDAGLPFGDAFHVGNAVGWEAGPAAASIGWLADGVQITASRIALWDGAQVLAPEDDCTLDKHVFAADGRIWSAELRGTSIAWSPLYP